MNQENKTYRLTCLFSPLLGLEELGKLVQEIKKEITDQEGFFIGKEVSAVNLIKKRLTYPIKKYQEAFFLNINFFLPAQLIEQFKKQITLKENIIRSLVSIQKKEKVQEEKIEESFNFEMIDKVEPLSEERTKIKEIAPKEDLTERKSVKEKVKIEELDKKLEEILNQ